MDVLSGAVRARLAEMLAARITDARRVRRGYTNTERWLVGLSDGRSVFVKVGVSEFTSREIRNEAHNLEQIRGARFAPMMIGWEDGDQPIIALEDLSHATWPPPWSPALIDRMRDALRALARYPVPEDTRPLTRWREHLMAWHTIADDPVPFLSLGVASDGWLERALPVLCDAEARAELDGDDLCHFDVRSDNMCLTDDRAILVDWNGLSRGRALFDLAAWAPSLHFEGGPSPEELVGHQPEYAAMISGYFAWSAGRPMEDWPGFERIRRVQKEQLTTALPWAIRALELPPLDGHIELSGLLAVS